MLDVAVRKSATDRKLRREHARLERKTNLRARSHDCALHSAARAYGVHVQVYQGAEQHRLHIAMGEPTCPACRTCKELRAAGKPPTVLSESEVDALLDYWEVKVDAARGGVKSREILQTRQELDRAIGLAP